MIMMMNDVFMVDLFLKAPALRVRVSAVGDLGGNVPRSVTAVSVLSLYCDIDSV